MISLEEIETQLNAAEKSLDDLSPDLLLGLGEGVLEQWVTARGEEPTLDEKEGFRLLALHRQGAKGDSSFNACRETCRELVYRYNAYKQDTPAPGDADKGSHYHLEMMWHVANHLYLFVSGKMQVAGLGEFCCASKPLRLDSA